MAMIAPPIHNQITSGCTMTRTVSGAPAVSGNAITASMMSSLSRLRTDGVPMFCPLNVYTLMPGAYAFPPSICSCACVSVFSGNVLVVTPLKVIVWPPTLPV